MCSTDLYGPHRGCDFRSQETITPDFFFPSKNLVNVIQGESMCFAHYGTFFAP